MGGGERSEVEIRWLFGFDLVQIWPEKIEEKIGVCWCGCRSCLGMEKGGRESWFVVDGRWAGGCFAGVGGAWWCGANGEGEKKRKRGEGGWLVEVAVVAGAPVVKGDRERGEKRRKM
ncbi:hypothetical protein FXO38_29000 [Capsicum annuum]|nr:hypothetical protein FXO38_29000 [Capsicum annuum]KAF3627260.1 hypothetical protein FXO37_29951 [Capsicum annuum]